MITRIAVSNFRSLRKVELDLGPLTVLIGPNGSGKTNLVDALRFIDSFAWKRGQLGDQVDVRGGWTELIWGGRSDSELGIRVEFGHKPDQSLAYSACMQELDNGDVATEAESLVANGSTPLIERRGEDVSLPTGRLIGHRGRSFSVVEHVVGKVSPMQDAF